MSNNTNTNTNTNTSSIKQHTIEYIPVDDLKFDPDNPNIVSEKQMHGLTESFKKFGYLSPIIVDQNNLIADGEHRAAVYKLFNIEQIPAYRIQFNNDVERRLLRQTMNKLRGIHDPERDLQELELIRSRDKEALEQMLAIGDREFELLKQFIDNDSNQSAEVRQNIIDRKYGYGFQGLATQMPEEQYDGERRIDPNTIEHHANTFLYGSIKQIILYFKNEDYQKVIVKMQEIMNNEQPKLKSHTDLFTFLLDFYDQYNNRTPATTTA